jgi:hypothetical protein
VSRRFWSFEMVILTPWAARPEGSVFSVSSGHRKLFVMIDDFLLVTEEMWAIRSSTRK